MNLPQEIEDLLEIKAQEEMFHGDLWGDEDTTPIVEQFNIKFVDSYGGEGCGDDYWAVWSYDQDGQTFYIKLYGWYASYNGSEYEGWKFVTPREKTITVYE
jgi:hypothetical protein